MLYGALVCFAVAVVTLVLGFLGVARGAAGICNAALLLSMVLLAGGAFSTARNRTRENWS